MVEVECSGWQQMNFQPANQARFSEVGAGRSEFQKHQKAQRQPPEQSHWTWDPLSYLGLSLLKIAPILSLAQFAGGWKSTVPIARGEVPKVRYSMPILQVLYFIAACIKFERSFVQRC